MSKQILYETEQYFTYKGKKLKIRFTDEYFDLVPRPINEEKKFLKEDIQTNGLHESIKINPEGVVLDGHTRIEICEECGWKKINGEPIIAKYEVRQFKTKQEERDYVVKINLMRIHLNSFQKVRLASKLYVRYNNGQHTIREQNRYDILLELKKHEKPIRASLLCNSLNMLRQNILKLLKGLEDDFCVRCEEEKNPKDTRKAFLFSILPKGEEVLSKGRPEKITLQSLGKSVGVGRVQVSQAIFLLNHAHPYMLARLEHGDTTVMSAYTELTKSDKPKRTVNKRYLKGYHKVVCPHCNKVSMKKDWKIYNGTS